MRAGPAGDEPFPRDTTVSTSIESVMRPSEAISPVRARRTELILALGHAAPITGSGTEGAVDAGVAARTGGGD